MPGRFSRYNSRMKVATLLFLFSPDRSRILLPYKKLGMGAGNFNGVGGKVEEGESVESAAIREALEEVGAVVQPEHLLSRGEITFLFKDKPDWNMLVHIFTAYTWTGALQETDEMRPEWFPVDIIPYDKMWEDDKEWLPQVVAGRSVNASFTFTSDGKSIVERDVEFT